jgi:hypothetical protein
VVHAPDAKLLETFDNSHDIHQSVHRAHLMQCDAFRGGSVHAGLRLSQQPERLYRTVPHPRGQRCLLDQCDQLRDVPMGGLIGTLVLVGVWP